MHDDHGKDKLEAHAKLLCEHLYVDSILTSLPFNSRAKDYIVKVTDDGLIDVFLYWEDEGFSMCVKTTGRNMTETTEIATILKERYSKGKLSQFFQLRPESISIAIRRITDSCI